MNGALLVCGTTSDAGKSVLVAGLCRWLARQGVSVAPFKAQNMALNAAVAVDGGEIGRAQAAQAAAAGVAPETAMNPILIKPGDGRSHVVVRGRPAFDADARSYLARKAELLPVVTDALADLRSRFDVVVCEGAGSPAEINLRHADLVNLGLARAAGVPTIVVGDIDRGGLLAHLHGTLALLEPADQALIAGFVVNRFRGDPDVLAPGLEQLRALTGRPTYGVLPHLEGLRLDAEDSLALDRPAPPPLPPVGADVLDVAVLRLPRISNPTDLDPLEAEPGVAVRLTTRPADVAAADLVVVPGTRATVADLAWLREHGLADALVARTRAGRPILGVCGGYQLLGTRIVDDVESRVGTVDGLGLLPVTTTFSVDKRLGLPVGTSPRFGDAPAGGYEIRHGEPVLHGGAPWLTGPHGDEGCAQGPVLGTSWHGVLEHDLLRRRLLSWVAEAAGRDWLPGATPYAEVREAHLDRLGDLVGDHLDTDALCRLIDEGAPGDLPVVPPAGAPAPPPVAATPGTAATSRTAATSHPAAAPRTDAMPSVHEEAR